MAIHYNEAYRALTLPKRAGKQSVPSSRILRALRLVGSVPASVEASQCNFVSMPTLLLPCDRFIAIMDASSDSGPGPDQARQVSVLVHRADGPGEEQRVASTQPASPSRGRRGARALRSYLGRLWRGTDHASSTAPRRLELSFSAAGGEFSGPPLAPRLVAQEAAAPDDHAPDDQEQGLVESAERHRLTTSIGLDLEGVSVFLELNAPYLGIMIFLFVCSHILLLLGFSVLTAALRRLNRVARDGIAARSDRDGRTTRRLLLAAAAAALTGLPALALLLQPRSVESAMRGFWSCLLLVVCVDSALRVLLSSCKVLICGLHVCVWGGCAGKKGNPRAKGLT